MAVVVRSVLVAVSQTRSRSGSWCAVVGGGGGGSPSILVSPVRRLGWITRGVGSNNALAHMATTVDRMWASRHGRDDAGVCFDAIDACSPVSMLMFSLFPPFGGPRVM